MKTPMIIDDYQYDKPIGKTEMTPEGLKVTMFDSHELTEDQLFRMFGHVGVKAFTTIKDDDQLKIKEFIITSFSLSNRAREIL